MATEPPFMLQEVGDDHSLESGSGEDPLAFDTSNDPTLQNLREISSLASWQVSTYKPGCGKAALLNPSPNTFWQSDGPQPHYLTIHFFKLVKIVRLRVYLDFLLDESYTPTKMEFYAGFSSSYGLEQFGEWRGEEPRGWQEISLEGVGVGGRAELRAMVVQVRVCENHQNGKDTHVRGVQVFAVDERTAPGRALHEKMENGAGAAGTTESEGDIVGLKEAEWMGDPEIR